MASPTRINLEEPVRVASLTRINLEEPIKVASPARINLEEPISSGYPAQTGELFFSGRNNDLYCTLSTYVTPRTISRQNQNN